MTLGETLRRARALAAAVPPPASPPPKGYVTTAFDFVVTHPVLREAASALFRDGYYAKAVEDGQKAFIAHVQQVTSGSAEGVPLMEWAFSEKNPVIQVNAGKTKAELDERTGYMFIAKGAVFLIRNPRVHNYRLVDSPERALALLGFTNHLFEVVDSAGVRLGSRP